MLPVDFFAKAFSTHGFFSVQAWKGDFNKNYFYTNVSKHYLSSLFECISTVFCLDWGLSKEKVAGIGLDN